jgi:multiple sugar transport system substrate-binding protein
MKKLYYVVIVWGLAGGCSSSDSSESATTPVTISYLRHDNPPYVKADDEFFAGYKKDHPNVTVADSTIKYQALGATLLAQLKTNTLTADLVRVIPSWVCSFADNLEDVPADILSPAEAPNTYFAAPLAGSTCGGKLKGLPIEYNLEYGGVVVNVDKYQAKFAKAPGWADWDAFINDASALTEYDANMKPMANGLDIDPVWPQPAKHIFLSQILQRGGAYWAADGTFDFSSPAAKDSLTAMVGWIKDKKVMDRSLVPDANTFVTTRLAMGATGSGWNDPAKPLSLMGYAGTWALANTVGQLAAGSAAHYDYFTLPPMVGTQHRFVQNSGFALVVPKTTKNSKVAWDIAKSLALSPEAARKWAATGGAISALKVNGTIEAAMKDPQVAKVQPLLAQGQWVGYIPAGAIETVEGAIVSGLFDVATGKKTIEQALVDMQKTANDALKQNL